MRQEVLMPKLGLTMTQGTVMEWLKKPGETVSKGQILFTVENDKAIVEVEAPADGVLADILTPAGASQEVGKPVAYLESSGQSPAEVQKVSPAPATAAKSTEPPPYQKPQPVEKTPTVTPAPSAPTQGGQPYVLSSPLAKRLAQEWKIDLSTVRGSGPGGAVVERDLKQAAPSAERSASFHTLSPLRARGAERMVQSWTSIPQFTLWADVEVDAFLELHRAWKEAGKPLSFTVLLAKFLALTLEEYPFLNGSWKGQGKVELYPQVDVGIAMDTPDGLVVPVLRDCGKRPLAALQKEWQQISQRAGERKLSPGDLAGGTITITNLGMFEVKRFQPIVNPPQAAILSVGEVTRRQKEVTTDPAHGPATRFVSIIEFGLTADHRVVDGAYAAKFLRSFKRALQAPLFTLASRV